MPDIGYMLNREKNNECKEGTPMTLMGFMEFMSEGNTNA